MPKKKEPILELDRHRVVTIHFALVNAIAHLREEIKKPTREHGPAESVAAIADFESLLEEIDQWLKDNPRQ